MTLPAQELTPNRYTGLEELSPSGPPSDQRELANWVLTRPTVPGRLRDTISYQAGRAAQRWAHKPNWLTRAADGGPMSGAIGYGLTGALLGGLGGFAMDTSNGYGWDNTLRGMLAAGLLGSGVGAASGHWRGQKQAYFRDGIEDNLEDARIQVMNKLRSQPMSFQEKAQLIDGVNRLSPKQLSELATALRGVAGATVGALVARYLMGWGIIGTAVAAATGALLGRSFGRPRTAGGYASTGNLDYSGNPITF